MLQIKDLSKEFHQTKVLNHLNFTINQGDLIYIHGINGSGKSTLFKIICGILKPNSGQITLNHNAHLGALIENPGFLENETIHYNLKFLASLKHNYDKEKIISLCKKFQLDYHSHLKLKNYSLGMRQKVGIIQAIMEDQNFILLDEPTRGLDQESIHIFCEIINQYHAEGKTIIIAAHDFLKEINYTQTYHLVQGTLQKDEIH